MYLKKILIFNFILTLLLLFIGCESTARKQTETLAYNQPLKIDNTIKKIRIFLKVWLQLTKNRKMKK